MYIFYHVKNVPFQLSKTCLDEDAQINKKLPKELLLRYYLNLLSVVFTECNKIYTNYIIVYFRIFSYLDVVSLCRCAQVSRAWNVLALDGSNWQKIDLFEFQTDVEVNIMSLVV